MSRCLPAYLFNSYVGTRVGEAHDPLFIVP
jgi:hypothetical protein